MKRGQTEITFKGMKSLGFRDVWSASLLQSELFKELFLKDIHRSRRIMLLDTMYSYSSGCGLMLLPLLLLDFMMSFKGDIVYMLVSGANKREAGVKGRGLKGKGVKTVYFVQRAVPTEQHEISEDNFEV